MKLKRILLIICALFLGGCAGFYRSCTSWNAQSFGGDWIIVQYSFDGVPINCWKLQSVSVSNEQSSDGIYWLERGHLVHISGWYNRVQVSANRFEEAASLLGIDLKKCVNGKYVKD